MAVIQRINQLYNVI